MAVNVNNKTLTPEKAHLSFRLHILRFSAQFFYHHDRWLNDYELLVFQVFYSHLSKYEKRALIQQLYLRDNYDRSHSRKLCMIGDRLDSNYDYPSEYRLNIMSDLEFIPKYENPNIINEFQSDGYKFSIHKNGKLIIRVVITTTYGLLREIQFTTIPSIFLKKSCKFRKLYRCLPYQDYDSSVTYSFDGYVNKEEADALEAASFKGG